MAGSLDTKFSALANAWAAASASRSVVVPDVGHNVLLEAPQALAGLS